MALYEDILGAIDDYKPSGQTDQGSHQISLTIKPMVAAGGGGATPAGVGGAEAGNAALTSTSSPSAVGPPAPVLSLGQQQILSKNPQLPGNPLGAYTDAQYEAQIAQQKNQYMTQYLDILKQLGWMDENNQFIPGAIQTNAERQRSDFGKQLEQSIQDVTAGAQRGNTLFSGRRAFNESQARNPFLTALSRLESDTANQVGGLFEQLGLLNQGFSTQQMLLLAEAAARAAQSIRDKGSQSAGINENVGGSPGSVNMGVPGVDLPAGTVAAPYSPPPGQGELQQVIIPGAETPYSTGANSPAGSPAAAIPEFTGTPTVSTVGGPIPGGVYRAERQFGADYDPAMAAAAVQQAAAGISSASAPQYQPVEPAAPPPAPVAPITQSMQNYYDAVAERIRRLMEG